MISLHALFLLYPSLSTIQMEENEMCKRHKLVMKCCRNGNHTVLRGLLQEYPILKAGLRQEHLDLVIAYSHFPAFCVLVEYVHKSFLYDAMQDSMSRQQFHFLRYLCESPNSPLIENPSFVTVLFRRACSYALLDYMKYLYSIYPSLLQEFVLDVNNSRLFKRYIEIASMMGNNEAVRWLVSLNGEFHTFVLSIQPVEITVVSSSDKKVQVDNTGCVVCYEEATHITSCGHQYCEGCIRKMQKVWKKQSCCYCRQMYTGLERIV